MACSYALALFGKEVSLILPVAAVFYHVAFGVRIRRASLFILIAVAAGFLALRAGVLSSTLPHLISQGSLTQRLPGFFIALISYLKILFWPAGLHMEYGNFLFPWNDPRVVAGAAVLGLLIWAFMWCRRRGLATAAFGIGWFAILLLPQSNLYPVGAFMAEHWLYLPSIGFFVIVALLLKQLIENDRLRNIGVAIFLIVAGGYTALTMAQAAYWKDPVHFYERTLKYVKTSRFCNNLGRIYAQQGDHRRAVELYEDALASGNPTAEVYVNAGVSYGALGMNSRAEEMFVRALALNPRSAEAFRSAGDLYTKMGRLAEALEVYRKSLAIKSDPGTLNNMAEAYRLLGHTGQAADLYKETIAKDEQNAESYNNLGALALQGARIDEAIELLQKAISFKNDYTDAMNNLGTAYSMKKEYDKAIELFRKCIALRPGFASAHNNLAVAYYSQGKMDDARAAERRAIELGFTANPRFLALLGLTADELSTP